MSQPDNILFLFADQMHAFAMGCMGTADIRTPNLDRLAAEGALFRNCYSSNPVCSPWRAALMSGRYSCQTGMIGINDLPMPPGERCLADCLNDAGYRTSYVGKWHIGGSGNIAVPPDFRCGFTDFIGFQCFNDFYNDVWFFDEDGNRRDVDRHRTDATVDLAIERLDAIGREPFALFVSWSNPHYPVQPAPEYERLYAGTTIAKRPNYVEGIDPFTHDTVLGPDGTYETNPDNLRLAGDMDEYLRLYYAMVTQLDAQLGRLLDELARRGLADRTAIVFTSDHGDMQGSHGLKNKHVPYEESTRCPLIVRLPRQAGGIVVDTPVDTVDFLPTLLEIAGAPPHPLAEGASLVPLASGSTVPHKEQVFIENGWPGGKTSYYMVRRGNHKLAVTADGEYRPLLLFDLATDPYELHDLVDDPALAELREELVVHLRRQHEQLLARANPQRWRAGDTGRWKQRLAAEPPLTPSERTSSAFIADYCARTRPSP